MSLNEQAINVITRPLPKDKIKTRPGKANMSFSYITPDFVIETLNEAFQFNWNTRLVYQAMHENVAVVGLELSVPAEDGSSVAKQQFGSCEVTRGLGIGEAFKGAASDALKKCATLLGLGLELYQDDAAAGPSGTPNFTPPKTTPTRPPGAGAPRPSAVPAPPGVRETPAAPPAAPPASRGVPAPPKSNPFAGNGGPASVPKPAAPDAAPPPPAKPAAPRDNPFANKAAASSGPNATQINAMTNLAQRKGVTPVDLIANANVVDDLGHAIQSFEELSRDQAIQVIKAAQQ